MNQIIANGDNVVLQIVEQQKSLGGIIIPEKAKSNQRDAIVGKVLAVGKGRLTEYGVVIEPQAKVGDYALISRGAGVEVEFGGSKVRIIRDCELLGFVEESRIISLGMVTP